MVRVSGEGHDEFRLVPDVERTEAVTDLAGVWGAELAAAGECDLAEVVGECAEAGALDRVERCLCGCVRDACLHMQNKPFRRLK